MDPVTLSGLALTGFSTAFNAFAARRVDEARARFMRAENARQRALSGEQLNLATGAQDRFVNFGGQQAERTGRLSDLFLSGETPASLMPGSSELVMAEEQRQRDAAREFTDQQGRARAELRAFSDLFGDIGRQTGRDADAIRQLSGFRRGSAAVLPFELEGANRAGDTLRTFADLAQGAGAVLATAGLSGAFGGGASASTPVPRLKPPKPIVGVPNAYGRPLSSLYG